LSKGYNSNILGTVLGVKLKLIGLVVRDVELAKRRYLHRNATASTHTIATLTIITTTASRAYATTVNFTATTTTTAIKTKDI